MNANGEISAYSVYRQVEDITIPLLELDSVLQLAQEYFALDKPELSSEEIFNYRVNHRLLDDVINHVRADLREMNRKLEAIKIR